MTDNKINETIESFKQILSLDDVNPGIKNIEFASDIFTKEAVINQELKNVILVKFKILNNRHSIGSFLCPVK